MPEWLKNALLAIAAVAVYNRIRASQTNNGSVASSLPTLSPPGS